MVSADRRIGENVQALRGDMSQAALAAAMKEQGWKWSQPTVAAVEKGDRPLKLAEALELCTILRAELSSLLPPPDKPGSEELGRSWWAVQKQIDDALYKLTALAGRLDHFAALAEANPDAVDARWGVGDNNWPEWVETTASMMTDLTPRRIVVSPEDRRVAIVRALESVARSVVTGPDSRQGA